MTTNSPKPETHAEVKGILEGQKHRLRTATVTDDVVVWDVATQIQQILGVTFEAKARMYYTLLGIIGQTTVNYDALSSILLDAASEKCKKYRTAVRRNP